MAGLLLAGCMQTGETSQLDTERPAAQNSSQAVNASLEHLQPAGQEFNDAAAASYVDTLVQGIAAKLAGSEMGEYGKAKAAFDYMIEHTVLDEPIGLEIWRIHGGGEAPIPYLEQRAVSPLQYGAGMCEDYAAALTLLLQGWDLRRAMYLGLPIVRKAIWWTMHGQQSGSTASGIIWTASWRIISLATKRSAIVIFSRVTQRWPRLTGGENA